MNYLDLFSGIGGFHLGILQAEVKIDKCYFSEVDKYAIKIYKQHFPDSIDLGDIRNIKTEELGKIDLITFGFPCQDLSIAGKRKGLAGGRSGLFFEAMRIIKELRPSIFIFENVKGLLTSNEGRDFEIVLREIADIGIYECEWQLVNTSWVLPQNRERVYFIGHLGEGSGRKVFPIGESDESYSDEEWNELSKQVTNTLRTNYSNAFANETYVQVIEATKQGYAVAEEGDSINLSVPNSKTRRGRVGKGAAQTLDTQTLDTQTLQFTLQNKKIRRLTEIECERLQGFPDNWTEGISSSQRYKCLGNAVSVPIVKMIVERLFTKEIPCPTK